MCCEAGGEPQFVRTRSAVQQEVGLITIDDVIAAAAADLVGPDPARDSVVTFLTEDVVVAVATVDYIVSTATAAFLSYLSLVGEDVVDGVRARPRGCTRTFEKLEDRPSLRRWQWTDHTSPPARQ